MADIKTAILQVNQTLKDLIEERTQKLLAEVDDNIKSVNSSKLRFTYDQDLLEQCSTFGKVHHVTQPLSPSRTHVTSNHIHHAIVDQVSYIDIHLINEDGNKCLDVTPWEIKVTLMNINEEVNCIGEMVKIHEGVVTYKYAPTEPGEHRLHVTINDRNANGSPFNVTVEMPLYLKCINTHTLDGFYKPGGVVVGDSGEVIIVDSKGYKTVHVYNSQLELMMSFGDWGGGHGQCYDTIGVALDLKGNFLFVDGGNHRIHKYDRTGRHVKTIGEKGNGPLQFLRPTGIGVNRAGYVYVCDRSNDRIQILKPDLTFDKFFGDRDQMSGNLHYPWDVAFDSQGLVYVTDPGNRCIKKYTENGGFIMKMGPETTGKKEDELKCVEMLCIDQYDYIYATDRDANRVVVFDTSGRYHLYFGSYGSDNCQFYQPRGIAKDPFSGALYVSEVGNKRVQKIG